jgi:hypothetical protein
VIKYHNVLFIGAFMSKIVKFEKLLNPHEMYNPKFQKRIKPGFGVRHQLLGERFGYLTVMSYNGCKRRRSYWNCICDCGEKVIRPGHELLKSNREQKATISCGCMKGIKQRLDLVGKRFGKLLVVESLGVNEFRQQIVKCKCACGHISNHHASSLVNGKIKSCGCKQKEDQLKHRNMIDNDSMMAKVYLYGTYKCEAKYRSIDFKLEKEEFFKLTSSSCHYCNKPPSQKISRIHDKNKSYTFNGIDRKDPNRGYSTDNVVPCCKHCNFAKHIMGYKEFLQLVKQIYLNLKLEKKHD